MNIVIASHTPRYGTFVVGSHHLAREFSKMGHRVLHLSPPITPFHLTKWRDATVRLRFRRASCAPVRTERAHENIYDWIPFSVLPMDLSLKYPVKRNYPLSHALRFRRGLLKTGFSDVDVLIIDHPYYWDLWNYINAKKIIYRPTDIYSASHPNGDNIRLREYSVIKNASAVVATSQPVLETLDDILNLNNSTVIENGVDLEFFMHDDSVSEHRARTVVYCGAIDDRFSWEIVLDIATALKNLEIHIYGELKGRSAPHGLPQNVALMGPLKYELLPKRLKSYQIAILPLVNSSLNDGRSPMKLYEYLSCGLPVVASATKELRRRNTPGVILADDSGDFIDAINRIISADWAFPEADVKSILLRSSWRQKAEEYINFINDET